MNEEKLRDIEKAYQNHQFEFVCSNLKTLIREKENSTLRLKSDLGCSLCLSEHYSEACEIFKSIMTGLEETEEENFIYLEKSYCAYSISLCNKGEYLKSQYYYFKYLQKIKTSNPSVYNLLTFEKN